MHFKRCVLIFTQGIFIDLFIYIFIVQDMFYSHGYMLTELDLDLYM